MGVKVHGKPHLPLERYKLRTATNYLVVHCAQTPSTWDKGIDRVREWHTKERGWIDVGYHYFIRRNGLIERGRPRVTVGSHVQGFNRNSIGICLAGGCDVDGREENNFTPEQWASLRALLVELRSLYPTAEIVGHRDFPHVDKYCPSFDVEDWCEKVGLA